MGVAKAVTGLGRVRTSLQSLGVDEEEGSAGERERSGGPQAGALQVPEPRQACTAPLSAHRHGLI